MSFPLPKTDAEHLVFLKSLSALKVRFALDWAARHPTEGFARALADRTFFGNLGVWNRAGIYDHPVVEGEDRAAWEAFLDRAAGLADRPDAEAAILDLLPPDEAYFGPRIAADQEELHDPVRGLAARPGALWTNPEPWTMRLDPEEGAGRILEFHIANHRYPGSFLADLPTLQAEVRALAVRARNLGFDGIGTRSWLNDHPVWLGAFPPAWSERRSVADPEDVGGHLGIWGQVITARQTLSGHSDRYVREKGRFEFTMRATWATIDEILG